MKESEYNKAFMNWAWPLVESLNKVFFSQAKIDGVDITITKTDLSDMSLDQQVMFVQMTKWCEATGGNFIDYCVLNNIEHYRMFPKTSYMSRKNTLVVSDVYVKKRLRYNNANKNMIEVKKAQIKLKRVIKEKSKLIKDIANEKQQQ